MTTSDGDTGGALDKLKSVWREAVGTRDDQSDATDQQEPRTDGWEKRPAPPGTANPADVRPEVTAQHASGLEPAEFGTGPVAQQGPVPRPTSPVPHQQGPVPHEQPVAATARGPIPRWGAAPAPVGAEGTPGAAPPVPPQGRPQPTPQPSAPQQSAPRSSAPQPSAQPAPQPVPGLGDRRSGWTEPGAAGSSSTARSDAPDAEQATTASTPPGGQQNGTAEAQGNHGLFTPANDTGSTATADADTRTSGEGTSSSSTDPAEDTTESPAADTARNTAKDTAKDTDTAKGSADSAGTDSAGTNAAGTNAAGTDSAGSHNSPQSTAVHRPAAHRPAAASTTTASTTTPTGASTEPERIVPADRAQSFTARWNEVKGDFVDEPREAVRKADTLVGEVLDEITRALAAQRAELERGLDDEATSTEDLRQAMQRYRKFFERLLTF